MEGVFAPGELILLHNTQKIMLEKIIQFLKNISLTKAAYNTFLKDIQRQVNCVKVDDSVSQFYVILEKEEKMQLQFLLNATMTEELHAQS